MTDKKITHKEIRYKENPFLGNIVVNKKSKAVTISTLGKDDNVLINQSTGEVQGTHITTYKEVDNSKFVKIFPALIGVQFGLKSAGVKVLTLLIWAVQESAIGKDLVLLDKYTLEKFIKHHMEQEEKEAKLEEREVKQIKFSRPVFSRGLNELEENKIIAKAERAGYYYINPKFLFNGDLLAFTTVYKRSNKDERQGDLSLE